LTGIHIGPGVAEFRARNIVVAIARLSDSRTEAQARRTGLIEASVEEAVRKLGPRAVGRDR
jgi:hypothetical protein